MIIPTKINDIIPIDKSSFYPYSWHQIREQLLSQLECKLNDDIKIFDNNSFIFCIKLWCEISLLYLNDNETLIKISNFLEKSKLDNILSQS